MFSIWKLFYFGTNRHAYLSERLEEIYINLDHEYVLGYQFRVINIVLIIIQRDIEWLPLNYEFLH